MSKICLVLPILGLLVFQNAATADELVKFPTGSAAWTVDITNSPHSTTPAPAAKKSIVKIEVAQDEQKRRSLVTWSNGETRERWDIPGQNLFFTQDTQGTPYGAFGGDQGARAVAVPFTSSDFGWLKPQFLQEKDPISYQGKECFHYQGTLPRETFSGIPHDGAPVKAEAWIESKTLLPVALDNGTALGTYTFQKNPPPSLSMPAKFQILFDHFEQGRGILTSGPP